MTHCGHIRQLAARQRQRHKSRSHDHDDTLVNEKLGDEKPESYGHEQELQADADVAEPDLGKEVKASERGETAESRFALQQKTERVEKSKNTRRTPSLPSGPVRTGCGGSRRCSRP